MSQLREPKSIKSRHVLKQYIYEKSKKIKQKEFKRNNRRSSGSLPFYVSIL